MNAKRWIWVVLFVFLLFISISCDDAPEQAAQLVPIDTVPPGHSGGDDDAASDDDIADDDDDDDDDDDNDDDDNDDEPITLDLVEGCNPFTTSEECVLPYPSAFFQVPDETTGTGYRVNLPENALPVPPGSTPLDMGPTNTADGVSPAGPILIHFGADVDPIHLTDIHNLADSISPDNPMALFNYPTGRRVMFLSEMDMNRKPNFPDRYALIVRPLEPMEMGMRHVVVLTKDLTDTKGEPLESPEAFAVLRDGIPTTNAIIEDVRDHYEQLFDFLEQNGYPRQNLLLAWDFMVASDDYLLGSILSMRVKTLTRVRETGLGYTITRVQDNPNEYVAKIVEGDFEVPAFLNDQSEFDYDENHHPIEQPESLWFPFTMILPKKVLTTDEPLPLAIFGHGIFGAGREYLTGWASDIIQSMAHRLGTVIIATDWIGLSSGDLDLILTEVLPDLNRMTLVTDRLQQSLINNLTMTELALGALSEDPQVKIGDKKLLDESRVYYYGVSLGGIQGSSFMSLSNRITRGVLAVPGSVWLNMIPRSVVWLPIKAVMDIRYPDPLVQQMGIAIIQTRFDHSDPINLSRLMYKTPLPDAPANRTFILQESIGDSQVPNMTTEMLARAFGVKLMTPSIYDVSGLDTTPSPASESVLVQYHLVEQEQANPPPEQNIPPTSDNGVHSDMCFLENVLEQVSTFMDTGNVVQYCEGACDPD